MFSILLLAAPAVVSGFPVTFGTSWDNVSLQDILDAEYGLGAIDVATGYEGYLASDGDPAYWEDVVFDGLIVREIAGFSNRNILGWHAEDLAGPPVIDGIDDGVVFDGPLSSGATATINFSGGLTKFGFYLNPNGTQDGGGHAPEPELFFANRFYNDLGESGGGSPHAPFDGDPQCLVFNITHLNNGIPTYILAWEDLDYGAPITPGYTWTSTDNDFQDLVVEIRAMSPVAIESSSWGNVKALFAR